MRGVLRYAPPDRQGAIAGHGMLTRNILFGMNILSLAGLLLMGFTLTLSRQKRLGAPLLYSLMGVGTALLFLGFYVGGAATP